VILVLTAGLVLATTRRRQRRTTASRAPGEASASWLRRVLLGSLGLLLAGAPAFPSDAGVLELDSFLCYKAKPTQGAATFTPSALTLVDAFESGEAQVVKPVALCNPADVDGGAIEDAETHLAGFQIKSLEKHVKQTGVQVETALGTLSLDTVKADRLLVPSAKSLEGPAIPPVDPPVDHFKCYKAKVSKGTPKFPKGVQVTVADQFDGTARTLDVKKPTKLCLPVDKNGEGIQSPDALLVCYSAKPAKGQAKHAKRTGVSVANQFGNGQLDTLKEELLCLASGDGSDLWGGGITVTAKGEPKPKAGPINLFLEQGGNTLSGSLELCTGGTVFVFSATLAGTALMDVTLDDQNGCVLTGSGTLVGDQMTLTATGTCDALDLTAELDLTHNVNACPAALSAEVGRPTCRNAYGQKTAR
jgi:hypothetical protein